MSIALARMNPRGNKNNFMQLINSIRMKRVNNVSIYKVSREIPKACILANSEDPEEMSQNGAFLLGLIIVRFLTREGPGKTTTYYSELTHIILRQCMHEISNNVVCATSKGSDQPAHMGNLIRAFARRLNILWLPTSFGVSKLNRRLHRLIWVYTCQNATLLENTCHGSFMIWVLSL